MLIYMTAMHYFSHGLNVETKLYIYIYFTIFSKTVSNHHLTFLTHLWTRTRVGVPTSVFQTLTSNVRGDKMLDEQN